MPRYVARSLLFARRRRTDPWRAALLLIGIGFLGAVWLSLPQAARELEQSAATPVPRAQTGLPPVMTGRVVSIVDGDGLVLGGGEEIRLGDFDAPEWREPGGPEAKAALSDIAYGKTVDCTPCEGARRAGQCRSYDRIIATCRLEGRKIGDLMRARGIREGGR